MTLSKKSLTKTERIARDRLKHNMYWLEEDHFLADRLRYIVPDAWHTLRTDVDVEEPKEKVTLYLDRSVVKYYRAMGKGYQARVNRILATFAQASIAGILDDLGHIEEQVDLGRKIEKDAKA